MSRCFIDHLLVTAPSLEIGAAFVKDVLGVAPQTGGEHLRMGTHNRLLRLGDALYLEVISPNAAVPAPSRPRWFGLDALGPSSLPALSGWVARTTHIQGALSDATESLGEIEGMNRGALDWLITIPCDGSLPLEGAGPALIEWQTEPHPASKLEDRGLSLAQTRASSSRPGAGVPLVVLVADRRARDCLTAAHRFDATADRAHQHAAGASAPVRTPIVTLFLDFAGLCHLRCLQFVFVSRLIHAPRTGHARIVRSWNGAHAAIRVAAAVAIAARRHADRHLRVLGCTRDICGNRGAAGQPHLRGRC